MWGEDSQFQHGSPVIILLGHYEINSNVVKLLKFTLVFLQQQHGDIPKSYLKQHGSPFRTLGDIARHVFLTTDSSFLPPPSACFSLPSSCRRLLADSPPRPLPARVQCDSPPRPLPACRGRRSETRTGRRPGPSLYCCIRITSRNDWWQKKKSCCGCCCYRWWQYTVATTSYCSTESYYHHYIYDHEVLYQITILHDEEWYQLLCYYNNRSSSIAAYNIYSI